MGQGWRRWRHYRAEKAAHAKVASLLKRALRETFDRWHEWQQRCKKRRKSLHLILIRKDKKDATRCWQHHAAAYVVESKHRRREAALSRILQWLLLLKCFHSLANNCNTAKTLRQLVESWWIRTLRNGIRALQQRTEKPSLVPSILSLPALPTPAKEGSNQRRLARPRKGHCRCVYDICRGQRCTCAARSHLLRRVEELHRLVAKGLNSEAGGCRLLSHVSQYDAAEASNRAGSRRRSTIAATGVETQKSSTMHERLDTAAKITEGISGHYGLDAQKEQKEEIPKKVDTVIAGNRPR